MIRHHCYTCDKDLQQRGFGMHLKMHRRRGDDNVKVCMPDPRNPLIPRIRTYNFSVLLKQLHLDAAVASRFCERMFGEPVELRWGAEQYSADFTGMTVRGFVRPSWHPIKNRAHYLIVVDTFTQSFRLYHKKPFQKRVQIPIPGQQNDKGLRFTLTHEDITPYSYHKQIAFVKVFAEKHYRESVVLREQQEAK